MQVEKISDTLHKFTLSLNDFTVNLAVSVGPDGILLVDTGWAQTAEDLNKQIVELSGDVVKLIIITHPHGDHIGGRGVLGKQATLIAHKNARNELAGRYFALDPLPGQELPLIALESELFLRFNGEDIKIIPVPGHTHSDIIAHFIDSGVVCMGDLLFSDTFPVLFVNWGGNAELYLENIEKLIEQLPADIKLIAGHGRNYSMEDLKMYYHMAVSTIDLVRQDIAKGKNAQDMIEENLLRGWEKWSSPQITSKDWITQVYGSLSGQAKKSIAETLTYTIMEKDVAAAIGQYQELKKDQPDSYNFDENELNMLGYQLLWREMTEAALEIFKLNVQVYPKSANPYDSLAEVYEAGGDVDHAIECYEKALAIEPNIPSAIAALKRLKPANKV